MEPKCSCKNSNNKGEEETCCKICEYSEKTEIDKHIEKRLNEDFLFYMEFTRNYQMRFKSRDDVKICQLWLEKLCSKRSCYCSYSEMLNRNRYLVQLVACMQAGRRSGVFSKPPKDGHLEEYPDPPTGDIEKPGWLENIIGDSNKTTDGRTYLATRRLDDGRGAFAYVALTLKDGEDEWKLPAGRTNLEAALKSGFEYALGDLETPDLATVLASRKTVEQRQGVMEFYKDLLKSIHIQLQGNFSGGASEAINDLLVRLVKGLKRDGKYKPLQTMPKREALFVLLQMLEMKIKRRMTRIERRELLLDEVERELITNSMLSETISVADKYVGVNWEDKISQDISPTYKSVLRYTYPPELVEFSLQKIQEEMNSIGSRSRRRHESMVSQLRADLSREQRLGSNTCDELNADISDLRTALKICGTGAAAQTNTWSTEDKVLKSDLAEQESIFKALLSQEEKLLHKIDVKANAANIHA